MLQAAALEQAPKSFAGSRAGDLLVPWSAPLGLARHWSKQQVMTCLPLRSHVSLNALLAALARLVARLLSTPSPAVQCHGSRSSRRWLCVLQSFFSAGRCPGPRSGAPSSATGPGWSTISLLFWAHTLLSHPVTTESQVTCTQQPQQDPTASTASRSLIEAIMAPFRLRHAIEAPLSLPVALSSVPIRSLLIHRPQQSPLAPPFAPRPHHPCPYAQSRPLSGRHLNIPLP